jgi:Heat shock protein
MKKIIFTLSIACFILQINACKTTNKTTTIAKNMPAYIGDENAIKPPSWAGTYTGIVNCTDCKGIQIQIDLSSDNTYKLTRRYLDKDADNEVFEGTFNWNADADAITLRNLLVENFSARFKVGDGILTQLDLAGNVITDENAQNYVVVKIDEKLVNKHWQLVEIFGEPVAAQPEGMKKAFITFTTDENRASGYSGCNSFSGVFQLKPGNRISISSVISTMRMCMGGSDIEKKMFEVINSADNYTVNGNKLTLNKARMAPLARFEEVPAE